MKHCGTDSKGNPIRYVVLSLLIFPLFQTFFPLPICAEDSPGIYSPSERPSNAPILKQFLKDDSYFDKALYGVSKPYPPSLMFLQDQGAWYTPFLHPGMLGKFDIRRWHQKTKNAQPASNISATSVETLKDTARK